MIEPELTPIELKKLRRAFRQAPDMAFGELRKGLIRVSEGFRTQHTRDKLRGRPGLILRHGQAGLGGAGSTHFEGSDINSLTVNTFIGGTARKYAEIQEFGTVGKGGTMPDIVPKKKKYLRFKVGGKWVATKRVSIPPRLGWISTWDSRDERREEQYRETLRKIAEGLSK